MRKEKRYGDFENENCKDGLNREKPRGEESENDGGEASLCDKLTAYSKSGAVAFHMPGHKRNVEKFLNLKCAGGEFDITEIDGFDNLNRARGIIYDSEMLAARIFDVRRAYYVINGSTGGILAAIRALAINGGNAVIAKNCHKSVYHAAEICRLNVEFVYPDVIDIGGERVFGAVTADEIENALRGLEKKSETEKGTAAVTGSESGGAANIQSVKRPIVIVESPTYEGIVSDIGAAAEVCKRHGAVLIVDEAHGAHLGLYPAFEKSARQCGADIVINSLHKTLSALTQTALLSVCSDRISQEEICEIERQLALFNSSSPSYVLLSSADKCVREIAADKDKYFSGWVNALENFYKNAAMLKNVAVLTSDEILRQGGFAFDKSKIVISVKTHVLNSYDGFGLLLAKVLRERFMIETEMAASGYVIAMTGAGDGEKSFKRLENALERIDREINEISYENNIKNTDRKGNGVDEIVDSGLDETNVKNDETENRRILRKSENDNLPDLMKKIKRAMPIFDAVGTGKETVSLCRAIGKVSAEYIWAYPPGSPIIVPGDILNAEVITALENELSRGVEIYSSFDKFPQGIAVVKTEVISQP